MTHTFQNGQEVTADNGKTYIVCNLLTADFFKGREVGYTVRTIRNGKPFGAGILMAQSRLSAKLSPTISLPIGVQVVEFFRECEKIVWEPK